MSIKGKILLFLVALIMSLFSVALNAKIGDFGDNRINKSIETENFVILYNENSEQFASEFSKNVEKWGKEIFDLYGVKPRVKIYVSLVDSSDVINSYALRNANYIYIVGAFFESFYTNWIENTFKHELTHNMNNVFNNHPVLFYSIDVIPDLFIRRYTQEGLAVLAETLTGSPKGAGRLNKEEFHAPIRYKFNENKIEPLFNNKTFDPYSEGASFFYFYYQTYGDEVFKVALESYFSIFGNLMTSVIGKFAGAAGVSKKELIEQYKVYLEKRYRIEDRNYVEGEIATKDYFSEQNYVSELISASNDKVYYYGNRKNRITGEYIRGIYSIDNNTGKIEIYTKMRHVGAVYVNKYEDTITYSQTDNRNYVYSQLASLYSKTKDGDYKKYDFFRASSSINVDGTVYYITNYLGQQSLMDSNDNVLVAFSENLIFENRIRYDKSTNSLYFAAARILDGFEYIYRYDLNTNRLYQLVEGRNVFVKDDTLYFSYSDNKSPYNIYSYNLNTSEVVQITDTRYGAMYPVVVGNDLYYQSFYNDAAGVYRMNLDESLNNKNVKNAVVNKEYPIKRIEGGLEANIAAVTINNMFYDRVSNTSAKISDNVTQSVNNNDQADNSMLVNQVNDNQSEEEVIINADTPVYESKNYNPSLLRGNNAFYKFRLNRFGIGLDGGEVVLDSLTNDYELVLKYEKITFDEPDPTLATVKTRALGFDLSYNPFLLESNKLITFSFNQGMIETHKITRKSTDENSINKTARNYSLQFNPLLYEGYGYLPNLTLKNDLKVTQNNKSLTTYDAGLNLEFDDLSGLNLDVDYSYSDNSDQSYGLGVNYRIFSLSYMQAIRGEFRSYSSSYGTFDATDSKVDWVVPYAKRIITAGVTRQFKTDVYISTLDSNFGVSNINYALLYNFLYGLNKSGEQLVIDKTNSLALGNYASSVIGIDTTMAMNAWSFDIAASLGLYYVYNHNLYTDKDLLGESNYNKRNNFVVGFKLSI